MNIDERIEALVQSVELLAAMHKDNEAKFVQRLEKIDERMAGTDKQIKRLGKYIHSLGTLVLEHEARLRSLEDDESDENATQQ